MTTVGSQLSPLAHMKHNAENAGVFLFHFDHSITIYGSIVSHMQSECLKLCGSRVRGYTYALVTDHSEYYLSPPPIY